MKNVYPTFILLTANCPQVQIWIEPSFQPYTLKIETFRKYDQRQSAATNHWQTQRLTYSRYTYSICLLLTNDTDYRASQTRIDSKAIAN